jgi:hypothetical protein
MIRKLSFLLLFVTATLSAFSQIDKYEQARLSYLAAFGWIDDGGVTYWATTQDPKDKNLPLAQLIERHRNFMYSLSPETGKKATKAAILDVTGREASQPEIDEYTKNRKTYGEITTQVLDWLKQREKAGMNEYQAVIQKAYQDWHNTKLPKVKLTEYRGWNVMRYHDWYKYFQTQSLNKKLSQTAGGQRKVQSSYGLLYVKDVVQEVNTANVNLVNAINAIPGLKNITLQGGSLIGQASGNVISTGSGNVISTGGGNWVSTNSNAVISTGGGNVISTGGGN